jgi:hypothetical protein
MMAIPSGNLLLQAWVETPGHTRGSIRAVNSTGYQHNHYVRFEVFTAVTMENGVIWDVTPCGSCKNRCFGGT